MCGRYTLTRTDVLAEELQAALGDAPQSAWWKARYNIAPTQPAPVVVQRDAGRTLAMMKWGLVKRPLPLVINARVETLLGKPLFRESLARRRCLVPATGFFEWQRAGRATPLPLYFHPGTEHVVAFAGLWANARTDAGEEPSFTIITAPANALVAPVHDRMPLVLAPADYARWLDPALDAEAARALLAAPSLADWRADPVSTHVNKAANDDAQCIALASWDF